MRRIVSGLPRVHRGGRLRLAAVVAVALILASHGSGRQTAVLAPGRSCAAPANSGVAGNCLTGDSGWDLNGGNDATIQGFATDTSVNVGQTVGFKIDTQANTYRVDIYRLGYYGGLGARKIASQTMTGPQIQPDCLTDPTV